MGWAGAFQDQMAPSAVCSAPFLAPWLTPHRRLCPGLWRRAGTYRAFSCWAGAKPFRRNSSSGAHTALEGVTTTMPPSFSRQGNGHEGLRGTVAVCLGGHLGG